MPSIKILWSGESIRCYPLSGQIHTGKTVHARVVNEGKRVVKISRPKCFLQQLGEKHCTSHIKAQSQNSLAVGKFEVTPATE